MSYQYGATKPLPIAVEEIRAVHAEVARERELLTELNESTRALLGQAAETVQIARRLGGEKVRTLVVEAERLTRSHEARAVVTEARRLLPLVLERYGDTREEQAARRDEMKRELHRLDVARRAARIRAMDAA